MNKYLGVDIGYGFSKCFDGENIHSFPTVVSNSSIRGGFKSSPPIMVDNQKYYVGANISNKWYDPRRADFLGSEEWAALVARAVSLSNLASVSQSVLVMGIPAGQFRNDKVDELISGLRRRCIIVDKARMDFLSSQIYFVPQGFGIFLKYIYDNDLHEAFKGKTYSIIDIGFYTLDLITIQSGQYISDSARTEPIGVSKLLDEVSQAFFAEKGYSLHREKAIKLIQDGMIIIQGETIKLRSLEDMVNAYCGKISNIVNSYMQETQPEVSLAGGGGVYVLSGHDLKLSKNMYVVLQPAEAQCIGYRYYGVDYNGN